MRIVLIHRYFWPDTPPYATFLKIIAEHLAARGHSVQIITSRSSYSSRVGNGRSQRPNRPAKEVVDGINITRLRVFPETKFPRLGRLLNLGYFPLRVGVSLLVNRSSDVVMCSTVPAATMGFFTALGARLSSTKFIYHCMDIHPEVGRISGEFRNSVVFNVLQTLDSLTTRMAALTLVLSEDMRKALLERKRKPAQLDVINNFALVSSESDSVSSNTCVEHLLKRKGMFRIVFAGNIGRFQRLDRFVTAMSQLQHQTDLEFVFVGEGVALDSLKKLTSSLELTNVNFVPHQTVSDARRIIADADLGVVSLEPEVYKYAFPSKTMTYLEEACPLFVCIESDSELYQSVIENELGYAVAQADSNAIAAELNKAFENRQAVETMRANCRTFMDRNYSEKVLLSRWQQIFNTIGQR